MKKKIVKVLSVMLAVVLTLTVSPLSGFVGLELPEWLDFSIKTIAKGTIVDLSCAVEFKEHYYMLFDLGGLTWEEAVAYCENIGGHLATITSDNEQSFVESLTVLGERIDYWLGGTEVDGVVTWITGEKYIYSNWYVGEPNNDMGFEEVYLEMCPNGVWNDVGNTSLENNGFICEWECYDNFPIKIGRNRLSFGENIKTTVGENLSALLQYTADKELLSSLEITSSNPDVVEVGTISNGSNRISCDENEYSAEIKLKPKKIGSSVITVTAPNGISESVTVNVGNTVYGIYESSVITVELDGGEDNYWASALKINGVEYSVNKNYSKQIDIVNNEDKYKNKEVVIVINGGEVVWIDTVDNIKVGLNATISLSQNNLYYTDKKYSTDKIYATIKVSSTCSDFPGNASVLSDIPSLQTSISSIELRTNNDDILTFDGEEVKAINTSSKLAFGKTETLRTVVINVDTSHKIPKKQLNEIVGISCTVSGERNGTPVSRTVATNVIIDNKNYSKPESLNNSSSTTSNNLDKAAQALESAIGNGNSAVNLGGLDISGTLKELFTPQQLEAIGAMILCHVAMASTTEDSLEEKLTDKVIKKILGIDTNSFKVDAKNGTLAVTVVTKTDYYGKISVKFTCNYYNYLFGNNKFAYKGDIDFEIVDGFEKMPSGFLQKGNAGMLTGADVTAFCNAAQDFALEMLNNSYTLAWGNDANNAADIIFGKSVNKILNKTKYGDVSGLVWKMLVTPAIEVKIYCPVDIYVYDSNNKIVVAVEDNNIIFTNDDNVDISIDGDTKIVRLFSEDYHIEYRSLAEYNMKVVVSEYGFSDCLIEEKVIDNIPLKIGTEFSQDCGESEYDVVEYSLIADNKEIYSPTDDSSAIHEHVVTDEWEPIQEPTCEGYGFNAALCSICNEWCKDIVAPTGHNYVNGFCTVCEENIEDNFTIGAMSSQIRFDRNEDGSYAEMFAVRTRAMISDNDFTELVGTTTTEAINNIDKIGFVYTLDGENFSSTSAQAVAQGEKVSGYIDAPVSYVQDADGYYMFTCLVTGIPDIDKDYTLTAYAYICVNGKWYFSEAPMNADFNSLYSTYYPKACEKYGW